jgi:hypothetical protein
MRFLAFFDRPAPYLGWGLLSLLLLVATRPVDPYVFGFTAIGAAWISGALLLAALLFGRRQLGWALLSAAPCALAFALLGTYKWA